MRVSEETMNAYELYRILREATRPLSRITVRVLSPDAEDYAADAYFDSDGRLMIAPTRLNPIKLPPSLVHRSPA